MEHKDFSVILHLWDNDAHEDMEGLKSNMESSHAWYQSATQTIYRRKCSNITRKLQVGIGNRRHIAVAIVIPMGQFSNMDTLCITGTLAQLLRTVGSWNIS